MKLRISDPVVVAVGPDSRTAPWGEYQFPSIEQADDGALYYGFSIAADNERAYGSAPGVYVSYDVGKTWEPYDPTKRKRVSNGLRLPNGDHIHYSHEPSIPLAELKLPEPIGKSTHGMLIYSIDELDESVDCPRSWIFHRYTREHPEGVREVVKLNWPHMMLRSYFGVLVKPGPRGRLRLAPDGSLWMPHYYLAGTDPETGEFFPHLCNYLFKSDDEGRSWELMSFLPFIPEEGNPLRSDRFEGFGENDIAFMPDGSMIRLIRSGNTDPCFYTRSEDGGHTWTEPEKFHSHGVWPCLLTLGCGVTLASFGRPGIAIRATNDPSGKAWEEPIYLVTPKDQPWETMEDQATCGYTNMIALDDRTAALVYSDFTVKDADGVPHKTMMFRTVTVED